MVAIKNACVGQELSLIKRDLTKKLKRTAASLGVEVKGIRFSLKHYLENHDEILATSFNANVCALRNPSKSDLENLELTESDMSALKQLASLLSEQPSGETTHLATDYQWNSRILATYQKQLRLNRWRITHNYPRCKKCNEAVDQLHGSQQICAECLYRTSSIS